MPILSRANAKTHASTNAGTNADYNPHTMSRTFHLALACVCACLGQRDQRAPSPGLRAPRPRGPRRPGYRPDGAVGLARRGADERAGEPAPCEQRQRASRLGASGSQRQPAAASGSSVASQNLNPRGRPGGAVHGHGRVPEDLELGERTPTRNLVLNQNWFSCKMAVALARVLRHLWSAFAS